MERRASLPTLSWPHLAALVAMLAAAGLAIVLSPKKVDASGGAFDLNALMPKEFGEWREVHSAFVQADLTPRRDGEEAERTTDALMIRR